MLEQHLFLREVASSQVTRSRARALAEVTELAQRAEVIADAPVLGDAIPFEAVDVDVIDHERLAGRRVAHPLARVGAADRAADHNLVLALERVLDLVGDVVALSASRPCVPCGGAPWSITSGVVSSSTRSRRALPNISTWACVQTAMGS